MCAVKGAQVSKFVGQILVDRALQAFECEFAQLGGIEKRVQVQRLFFDVDMVCIRVKTVVEHGGARSGVVLEYLGIACNIPRHRS